MSESEDLMKYIKQAIKTGGTISMESFKKWDGKTMVENEMEEKRDEKYGEEYDKVLDEYIDETCRMQDKFYTDKEGDELNKGIEQFDEWFDANLERFVKRFMDVGLTKEEALSELFPLIIRSASFKIFIFSVISLSIFHTSIKKFPSSLSTRCTFRYLSSIELLSCRSTHLMSIPEAFLAAASSTLSIPSETSITCSSEY